MFVKKNKDLSKYKQIINYFINNFALNFNYPIKVKMKEIGFYDEVVNIKILNFKEIDNGFIIANEINTYSGINTIVMTQIEFIEENNDFNLNVITKFKNIVFNEENIALLCHVSNKLIETGGSNSGLLGYFFLDVDKAVYSATMVGYKDFTAEKNISEVTITFLRGMLGSSGLLAGLIFEENNFIKLKYNFKLNADDIKAVKEIIDCRCSYN